MTDKPDIVKVLSVHQSGRITDTEYVSVPVSQLRSLKKKVTNL